MKKIILTLLLCTTIATVSGQTDKEQVMKYRRSSLYSLMVSHTDQQFAPDIKAAFLQIPMPERFNNHDLSVKVLTLNYKLSDANSNDENSTITDFLIKNKVASRLVARWFNRDSYTGACNMELVKERGLYNASEFDRQLALHSARGLAMLQDAGEDLIGNTFVIVNDIHYIDKNEKAQTVGNIIQMLGAINSAFNGSADWSETADKFGQIAETIKGFSVRINTFLYRLEWNQNIANLFYQEQYSDKEDKQKKANFDNARSNYHLKYVGKVESKGSTTSFIGISEKEPLLMLRKACQRAIDDNIVNLQHAHEEFRTKTPLQSVNPITAYIGMKDGVTSNSRYEVLETEINDNGTYKYNKVGEVEPVPNMIWDNRFMATEEGSSNAGLGCTTFRAVSGKNFARGMLIREITK